MNLILLILQAIEIIKAVKIGGDVVAITTLYFPKITFIAENMPSAKAFKILGINVGLKWDKIQEKFKKLVKKFHPDMNAGNKKFEDKLKVITLAYTQLKNTYKEKN